jgi:HSP20 family protein
MQDPQQVLGNLQDEMNRVFDRVWHGGISTRPFDGQQWAPALDVHEFPDRFVVHVEVPGVDGHAVSVTCAGSTLTLRGEKRRSPDIGSDTPSLYRERRFGSFCRSVELQGKVQVDQVVARCQNGLLEITVPKVESERPRAVRVDVTQGSP